MTQDSYASRLHWVGIATLVVLIGALGWVGWSLRPASGAYPEIPSALQLYLPRTPGSSNYAMSLTHTGSNGAELKITGPALPVGQRWTLLVNNLGPGRLCTPSGAITLEGGGADATMLLAPQHLDPRPAFSTVTPGSYHVVGVDGSGLFYVKLCWGTGQGPVRTNGAYLSALFPPFIPYGGPGAAVVARQLNLGEGNTADFSVQSQQAHPDNTTAGGWQWFRSPPPAVSLSFNASNTTETQHDTYRAFLSGIVLGVAGGALVALVQELVAPFRSRRELRSPEPGA